MNRAHPWRLAGILALLLAGCASHPPAPVVDLSGADAAAQEPAAASPTGYRVQAGDSLYSIAFHHDLDWRQLARWNGIAAPYTIYPGMDLRLDKPPEMAETAPGRLQVEPLQRTEPAPVTALPPTSPARGTDATTPSAPIATTDLPSTPAPPARAEPTPPPVVAPGAVHRASGVAWSWPSSGPVIDTFRAGDPTRHGIDIGGETGDPVLATANGVVVYSGNGLVGYGELIIIKHSEDFLSAYGHNSKRLVREGQRVSRGEVIAEMGSSGTSRTELHFEIRRQGDPVDPMAFLPSR